MRTDDDDDDDDGSKMSAIISTWNKEQITLKNTFLVDTYWILFWQKNPVQFKQMKEQNVSFWLVEFSVEAEF